MKTFEYTITDAVGIHARPAGLLVKEANKYDAVITICKEEKKAEANKLMKLMSLGIKQGETIKVTIEGVDEENAAAAMESFFKENL